MTSDDQPDRKRELEFDVAHRSANGRRLVGEDREIDPAGSDWRNFGRVALTASTTAMTFDPGWR